MWWDVENALDQLEKTELIEMFEFHEEITTMVKTVYISPTTQLYVNGT